MPDDPNSRSGTSITVHEYSVRSRILVLGLIILLWYWTISLFVNTQYSQLPLIALVGLPILLGSVALSSLVLIWRYSSIKTDIAGIQARFFGIPILSFRWNEIYYVQKAIREKPFEKRPSQLIEYLIFSKNTTIPIVFTEFISDVASLLTIINAASTESKFDLFAVNQTGCPPARGFPFARTRSPKGQRISDYNSSPASEVTRNLTVSGEEGSESSRRNGNSDR